MPGDILQLGIDIDTRSANTSIFGLNKELSVFERNAMRAGAGASEGFKEAEFSAKAAREAAAGFGEVLGVHIPRFVRSFLVDLKGVGTIMASAFSGFAVLGLLQVLSELPDAFEKLIGKVTGWDEASKKAYDDFIEDNHRAVESLNKLKEAQEGISLIGLSGSAKSQQEIRNIRADVARASDALTVLQRRRNEVEGKINQDPGFVGRQIEKLGPRLGLPARDDLGDLEKELAGINKQIGVTKDTIVALQQIKLPTLGKESAVQALEDAKKSNDLLIEMRMQGAESIGKFELQAVDERIKHELDQQDLLKEMRMQGAQSISDFELKELGRRIDKELEEQQLLNEMRSEGAKSLNRYADKEVEDRIRDEAKAAEAAAQYTKERFNTVKREAGEIFDVLLSQSKSFVDRVWDIFKIAFLTPLKDALSTGIAASITGYGAPGAARGGGGLLGAAAGMISPGGFGNYSGGPGGTGGFAGPVGGNGGGGFGSILSGAGILSGLKGLAFNSGSISLGAGHATTAAGIGGLTGGLAGVATSPLGLLAGSLLLGYGLKRGGLSGLGMSIGGGALTGAALGTMLFPGIGTVVGAAIGAVAGGIGGLIGLFRKSAEEKAHDKIKSTYGIDIREKNILTQIVGIAKNAFGGNLDVAIQSQGVRDLIQLYGMSTGQKTNLPAAMSPVTLSQSGGSLYSASGLGGSSIDRIASGYPASAPAQAFDITVPLNIDGNELDRRTIRVIARNGRVVQAATLSAVKSNSDRREAMALQLSPSTLVS